MANKEFGYFSDFDKEISKDFMDPEYIYKFDEMKHILSGKIYDRKFEIRTNPLGAPVAYIEVFKTDALNNDTYMNEILGRFMVKYDLIENVHGGGTFYGECYWDEDDKTIYVGWDYCHAYDYYPRGLPEHHFRKWTIIDILGDVRIAMNEINRLNFNCRTFMNNRARNMDINEEL